MMRLKACLAVASVGLSCDPKYIGRTVHLLYKSCGLIPTHIISVIFDWRLKLMFIVLTLYSPIVKSHPECSHLRCEKALSAPAVRLGCWRLSIKLRLKVAMQVCLLATMLRKPKPLKEESPVHMDSQTPWWTWTVWFVHFAKRIRGKLRHFTVVNLGADIC